MESDFTIRNHLDSINASNDPSVFELLNRYKESPNSESTNSESTNSESPAQSSRLGDHKRKEDLVEIKEKTDGLSLSVGPDVIKWVILLVIVISLVYLLDKRKKKSKLSKRMKKIEKELIRLRRNSEKDT